MFTKFDMCFPFGSTAVTRPEGHHLQTAPFAGVRHSPSLRTDLEQLCPLRSFRLLVARTLSHRHTRRPAEHPPQRQRQKLRLVCVAHSSALMSFRSGTLRVCTITRELLGLARHLGSTELTSTHRDAFHSASEYEICSSQREGADQWVK